ncbi:MULTISPECIES: hypothetical protein [unclassified Staphylococcus]|uniref:hypothetical protein n=1 Tax=unclassified Staphylococcus TaxID=91994 RepID=UPI00122E7CC6|nr:MULTISPECIES: hypothetical protein [unclassified Staphylococcus]KAA2274659.1 hypothetical protein F1592_08415 [Staphylococcus sp. GDX7P312P]KAA2278452.1 hypothetical protein F1591_12190 [Staphylococcus sp. GDX7P459A]
MYKKIFKKEDGTPSLIEGDEFNSDIYTDIQPPNGLYQPIHFDGKKWIGTPYEEWLKQQPKVEVEEVPDEKDILIADLTLQLMETQNTVENLQNDMANLTLQFLESDSDA